MSLCMRESNFTHAFHFLKQIIQMDFPLIETFFGTHTYMLLYIHFKCGCIFLCQQHFAFLACSDPSRRSHHHRQPGDQRTNGRVSSGRGSGLPSHPHFANWTKILLSSFFVCVCVLGQCVNRRSLELSSELALKKERWMRILEFNSNSHQRGMFGSSHISASTWRASSPKVQPRVAVWKYFAG